MHIPIVISAFGTTTRALKTYFFMEELIRARFPGHEIRWAYSSRVVRHRLKEKLSVGAPNACEILEKLHERGHSWAVVQSLHMIWGHEFYRLLEEVGSLPIRTSIGLPLLSSPEDYRRVARGLGLNRISCRDEAVVLVGHGTDHPSWSSYPALEAILREVNGPGTYVGVIEGHPSREQVLRAVVRSGVRTVRLIPFMLVAGSHFKEDLAGGDDSWNAAFERAGLKVQIEEQGIGFKESIVEIFTDHIRDALDVIPVTGGCGAIL
jgi:sirohydrochlorin cobaltochelatase